MCIQNEIRERVPRTGLSVIDLFCGGGGGTQGAEESGMDVKFAVNHSEKAIFAHNDNFQNTDHDCADINSCNPKRYPKTDIMIAGPECTNHSNSNGKKKPGNQYSMFEGVNEDPLNVRSRMTMFDPVRFAEVHKYKYAIIENVVEVMKWRFIEPWFQMWKLMGYEWQTKSFNSMFFGSPQSRDRIYIVFNKKGYKRPDLEYRPKAYCDRCEKVVGAIQRFKNGNKWGKYGQQYDYRCSCGNEVMPFRRGAWEVINWDHPIKKIGEKRLVKNTMDRIQYGLDKYYGDAIIRSERSKTPVAKQVRGIGDVLWTQTTTQSVGFMVRNQKNSFAYPMDEPIKTVTTVGKEGVCYNDSFLSYYYKTPQSSRMDEPMKTIRTKEHISLIQRRGNVRVEDCYYRMLKTDELKKGMSFHDNYKLLGNSKEDTRLLGNAMTPPTIKYMCDQINKSLNLI